MTDTATELNAEYTDGAATVSYRFPVDPDLAARAETNPAAMAEIYQAAAVAIHAAADRIAARRY